MTRGGARPGAGKPPVAGQPQTERIGLKLTEAERAEIEGAVPDDQPVGRWIVEAAIIRARSELPMSLRDVLHKALNSGDHEHVVIMRAGSDYQVRLTGPGLTRVEMRYVDDECRGGNLPPACPWFQFEGFSVEAALANDWEIVDVLPPATQR